MATNTQKTGVRKFLTDSGYKDTDIGYDANRGMVTLQGKDFYSATPEADSSTYGNYGDLSSSLNNYRNQQQKAQLDPLVATLTNRATAAPAASYTPQAYGGFNPNNNASFQAAMNNATAGIAKQQANTNAQLRASGQGKSSYSETVANQIGTQGVANAYNTLLPQYEQMDYSRYRDTVGDQRYANETDYARSQDQTNALNQLVSYLTGSIQQGFSNDLTTRQQDAADRAANWNAYTDSVNMTGNLGTGPKNDWQLLGGTGGAPSYAAQRAVAADDQWQQGFDQDVLNQNRNYQLNERQTNASIANASQDNIRAAQAQALAAGNQQLAQLLDIWDRTGQAPAGLESLGVRAGTPLAGSSTVQTAEGYSKYLDGVARYEDVISGSGSRKVLSNPEDVERAIFLSGLPESDLRKLYARYGLKWGE